MSFFSHKIYLFVFAIFYAVVCTPTCEAQKLYFSPTVAFNTSRSDFSVLGAYKDKMAFYINNYEGASIRIMDDKLLVQREIPMDFLPSRYEFVRCIVSKSSLFCLYYTTSKSSDRVEASLLLENETWSPSKVLFENNDEAITIVKVDMASSEHNTKHLLRVAYRKQGLNFVKLIVLNNSLETERAEDIELSDKEKKMLPEMAISDTGTPLLLFSDPESYKTKYHTLYLATAQEGSRVFHFSNLLNAEDKAISDLYLKVDNVNQQALVLAWYDEHKNAAPKGLFKGAMDLISLEAFPSQFVTFNTQTKAFRSEWKDVKIRNVSITKNGGCEVVAERELHTTRTINNQPMMITQGMPLGGLQNDMVRSVKEYYNDEIMIFNLEPNGKLAWSQMVFKEQFSSDDNGVFLSYLDLESSKGKVYVYNDFSAKNDRVIVSYVAANGGINIRELPIKEDDAEGFSLMPRFGKQVSKNALIIPMLSKSNLRFLKIAY